MSDDAADPRRRRRRVAADRLLRLLGAAGFEARGYGSTGEFLLQPPPDRPGCVLLDLRMPGPSGLELQAALSVRASRCR